MKYDPMKYDPSADGPEAVSVLILHPDGRVLACARKHRPYAWGMPGGKVDEGETAEQAAVRELEEETGVEALDMVRLFGAPCVNEHEGGIIYYNNVFLVTRWEGTPKQMPGEGLVAWKDWAAVQSGPFGTYNRLVELQYERKFSYEAFFHRVARGGVMTGLTHPVEWAIAGRSIGRDFPAGYFPRFLVDMYEASFAGMPRSSAKVMAWCREHYPKDHLARGYFDDMECEVEGYLDSLDIGELDYETES